MMDINDWIEKEGVNPENISELRVPNEVISINGIEKFINLKSLILKEYTIRDFSALESERLRITLQEIEIVGKQKIKGNLKDISFLDGYHLKKLKLSNCNSIKNYSSLNSASLKKSLTTLAIDDSSPIIEFVDSSYFERIHFKDIQFLKGYKKLKSLDLSTLPEVVDFSPLNSASLKKTLRELWFGGRPNLTDISFLKSYQRLETLFLENCVKIKDYSALKSKSLSRTLRKLFFANLEVFDESLKSISFLKDYSSLEVLCLEGCQKIADFNVLARCELLKKSLELISFQGCRENKNLEEINFLKDYTHIKDLNLDSTAIRSVSSLLDFEFVKNRSLKEISLPDSLDWTLIKDGKYIHAEIVQELKRRGVKVNLPSTFPFKPELEPQPKLYIICGPPGTGKSTLIKYMVEELGVKELRKTTTREYRENEIPGQGIIQIPLSSFEEKFKQGQIQAYRELYDSKYGIDALDLMEAYLSKEIYLIDSGDPQSALDLRNAHLDFVEVVMVMPSLSLTEFGLKERLRLDKKDKTTLERLRKIVRDNRKFSQYLLDADYRLEGNYESNIKKIKEIITKK